MRKVIAFLGASLCLAAVAPAFGQAAGPFKDVDPSHWAYPAIESLRQRGILQGYPGDYFRGKRVLTRYEFAIALDRAIKELERQAEERYATKRDVRGVSQKGEKGDKGDPGPPGPPGPKGDPGISPQELETFRRLAREFREELTMLGNNMNRVMSRLDQMAKDIEEIKGILDKMPKWSGTAFMGLRADRVSGGYVDYDGRLFSTGASIFNPTVVHTLSLGVTAPVGKDTRVNAALNLDNYKQFVGNYGANVWPAGNALNNNPAGDVYLDKLEVVTPFGALGTNSKLTLGRFHNKISKWTLWKPDVDRLLYNPVVDDGSFRMDGVKFSGQFGSVDVTAFGATTRTVQGTNGLTINNPVAGAALANGPQLFAPRTPATGGIVKPRAQVDFPGQRSSVDLLLGLTVGLDLKSLLGVNDGKLNLIALDANAKNTTGAGFNHTFVFGADATVKLNEDLSVNGSFSKTITGNRRLATYPGRQSVAADGMVHWKKDALSVGAGYRYVEPMFYAPGYWGAIGNWINPTNIQGPRFRAAYDFSPRFGVNIGGEYYTGARNRQGVGGLSMDDKIYRVLAGIKWGLSKELTTTFDWEGVYWSLDPGGRTGGFAIGPKTSHPEEHYFTIGAGYHLSDSTMLSVKYQIGDFNGRGTLSGGPGVGTRYNFNTVTSSVTVKF